METHAVVRAWGRILTGYRPTLSVEITRECPLRCPGCYAYGDAHLGGGVVLRELADFKGQALVDGLLALARRHRPVQLSLVGGEPLVRFRELDEVLPQLGAMGIHTQVVTSAVRPIPRAWADIRRLQVVVSIDGLQPEHDLRRAPATYERILKHIEGQHITIHCTLTRQQARPGYATAFTEFWAPNPNVKRIWFSMYTPQQGEQSAEMLTQEDRRLLVDEIGALHARHPKLMDMIPAVTRGYLKPPTRRTTASLRRRQGACRPTSRHESRPVSTGAIPTAPSAAAWRQSVSRRSVSTGSAASSH